SLAGEKPGVPIEPSAGTRRGQNLWRPFEAVCHDGLAAPGSSSNPHSTARVQDPSEVGPHLLLLLVVLFLFARSHQGWRLPLLFLLRLRFLLFLLRRGLFGGRHRIADGALFAIIPRFGLAAAPVEIAVGKLHAVGGSLDSGLQDEFVPLQVLRARIAD